MYLDKLLHREHVGSIAKDNGLNDRHECSHVEYADHGQEEPPEQQQDTGRTTSRRKRSFKCNLELKGLQVPANLWTARLYILYGAVYNV